MNNHPKHRSAVAAILATAAFVLTGCVTNEELGNPDGWEEILPPAKPELVGMVPQKFQDKGTLSAAANAPYAPNEFKDSEGKIIGFEMDLVRAAGSKLGLDVVPRQMDFNLILPAVSAGTIDVGASAFTDTEERQKNYDFVDFFSAGIAWATQPGRENSIDPDNACGLTVAVQKGTYSDTDEVEEKSQACVENGKPAIDKLVYPTADAAATATILKRADAYSSDSSVTAFAIQRSEDKLVQVGEAFDTAPFGWAFPKGSELGRAFAAALQDMMDDGTYDKILKPWGLEEGALDEVTFNLKPLPQTRQRHNQLPDATGRRTRRGTNHTMNRRRREHS